MKCQLFIRYRAVAADSPESVYQDHEIESENGGFLPIPNEGDTIRYFYGGKLRFAKVVSRHLSYHEKGCTAEIVVTDVSKEEIQTRTTQSLFG